MRNESSISSLFLNSVNVRTFMTKRKPLFQWLPQEITKSINCSLEAGSCEGISNCGAIKCAMYHCIFVAILSQWPLPEGVTVLIKGDAPDRAQW